MVRLAIWGTAIPSDVGDISDCIPFIKFIPPLVAQFSASAAPWVAPYEFPEMLGKEAISNVFEIKKMFLSGK